MKLSNIELKRLFEFASKENHFLFKVSFYDEGDGETLGSPLAPGLPNHFMGHHENIWLDQYGDSEVLYYRRYVDDTFCLFQTEQDTTLTLITSTINTLMGTLQSSGKLTMFYLS